jgi:hypothetical protein
MKLKLILFMLTPVMQSAIQLLRNKDANTTGWDDIAANQLEAALVSLQQYLSDADTNPLPV